MSPRRRQVCVLVWAAVMGLGVASAGPVGATPGWSSSAAGQVPRTDPAAQRQVSLSEAMAGQRTTVTVPGATVRVGRGANVVDTGRTVEKPVRRESVSRLAASPRSTFGSVFSSPTAARGGCRTEYGTSGQCLPRVPPSQSAHAGHGMRPSENWSCTEVRTLFASGVALRAVGVDPLGLDRNRDGIGCGRGD